MQSERMKAGNKYERFSDEATEGREQFDHHSQETAKHKEHDSFRHEKHTVCEQ